MDSLKASGFFTTLDGQVEISEGMESCLRMAGLTHL